MGPQLPLFVVVKILSDFGYTNTVKKLVKEAKDATLTVDNIPDGIKNFNFNALVAGLTAQEKAGHSNTCAPVEKLEKAAEIKKDDTSVKAGKPTKAVKVAKKGDKVAEDKEVEEAARVPEAERETEADKSLAIVDDSDANATTDPVAKKQKRRNRDKKDEPEDVISVKVPTGRFKRIQDDVWMERIKKDELKQNSYTMKKDEFSLKAAQELIQVKGKNFRTEKNKKKRASWKGSGEITTQVNSIKFDDSDSE